MARLRLKEWHYDLINLMINDDLTHYTLAKELGKSIGSIRHITKQEHFIEELNRKREIKELDDQMSNDTDELSEEHKDILAKKSLKVFKDILDDPGADPNLKQKVAKDVLTGFGYLKTTSVKEVKGLSMTQIDLGPALEALISGGIDGRLQNQIEERIVTDCELPQGQEEEGVSGYNEDFETEGSSILQVSNEGTE